MKWRLSSAYECSTADIMRLCGGTGQCLLIRPPKAVYELRMARGPDIKTMSEEGETSSGERFDKLVQIMATLRGPNGCPWDKQQDFNSLKPMLVEEVYEVLEAIDNEDFDGLAEELGDLLLHVI